MGAGEGIEGVKRGGEERWWREGAESVIEGREWREGVERGCEYIHTVTVGLAVQVGRTCRWQRPRRGALVIHVRLRVPVRVRSC